MDKINAKEILEVAIEVEKNGYKFYTILAKITEQVEVKELFEFLAQEEKRHIKDFSEILRQVQEDKISLRYDTSEEELYYLKAIADTNIFTSTKTEEDLVNEFIDANDAIHFAVSFEIKSVEFFRAIYEQMAPGSGQEAVIEIIRQEKNHVTKLHKMLSS